MSQSRFSMKYSYSKRSSIPKQTNKQTNKQTINQSNKQIDALTNKDWYQEISYKLCVSDRHLAQIFKLAAMLEARKIFCKERDHFASHFRENSCICSFFSRCCSIYSYKHVLFAGIQEFLCKTWKTAKSKNGGEIITNLLVSVHKKSFILLDLSRGWKIFLQKTRLEVFYVWNLIFFSKLL